ncbi:MAG: motility protein A [Syntrophomonadaceae bacterium]|nr:motility protein A [Syntrophomonadaceae bacterium]
MKWDVLTPLGIALGFTLVFIAVSLGSSIGIFLSFSSFLVTIGGSFSALLVNYRWKQIAGVFKTLKKTITTQAISKEEIAAVFVELARKTRREGLLGLEDDLERMNDRFYKKALQLVIDALDPANIKQILEADMEATMARHEIGQGVFRTWAILCPAFGMIGTLIGLIQMLSKLDDPSALGPSMALALITTFYGALLANLVFIPIAGKLELLSEDEMLTKQLILVGVLELQAGTNPRILEEKLNSYVEPKSDWLEDGKDSYVTA